MRFSPFRPHASTQEKIYTVATLSWMASIVVAELYYMNISFGLEKEAMLAFLPFMLPLAFLHWLPLYRDRNPSNPILAYSRPWRAPYYCVLFLVSFTLVWWTLNGLIGPFVTNAYGATISSELLVTQKSNGFYDKRSCNYFVWLRDPTSGWTCKVCVGEEMWGRVSVGQVLVGTGKQSPLGRTIEQLSPREN